MPVFRLSGAAAVLLAMFVGAVTAGTNEVAVPAGSSFDFAADIDAGPNGGEVMGGGEPIDDVNFSVRSDDSGEVTVNGVHVANVDPGSPLHIEGECRSTASGWVMDVHVYDASGDCVGCIFNEPVGDKPKTLRGYGAVGSVTVG